MIRKAINVFGAALLLGCVATAAHAQRSDSDLSRALENPSLTPVLEDAPTTSATAVSYAGFDEMDASLGGSCRCGCNSVCCREKLTGDWWGRRSGLAECGIVYNASITQFYQGVTSGGNEQTFRYGAKIDQYFIFDTARLGLWHGGKLIMHAESQLGQNSILDAPALAPVNTVMLFPLPEPVTAITNFQYMQELGGGYAATVGKFNFVDLWQMLYPEFGAGLDGFMNVSVIAPLNVIPTLPVVFNGAGLLKIGERGVEAGIMAIDPRATQTVAGLDHMFDNGVTIFGLARRFTDFGGLPGSHLIGGTYATGTYTSLDRAGWNFFPGDGVTAGEVEGSWMAAYVMEQKLWVDCCNPKRSIGLWGMAGFSDPESSPYDWTMNASLQAFGLNPCREGDRMGIGYFYQGLSEDFKNLPGRLAPLQNMQGGEVYYNAEITPWFHVTADLQVVEPALQDNDTAVIFGLRAKIDL